MFAEEDAALRRGFGFRLSGVGRTAKPVIRFGTHRWTERSETWCSACPECRSQPLRSRVDKLVALLLALESLHPLLVHLLGHLLVTFLLLLLRPLLLKGFDASLCGNDGSAPGILSPGFEFAPTLRSASFSSLSSFSLALTAASNCLSFVRFSYDVNPEPGRKAFLGACHCFPVG